jgi:hypothetical protein
LGEKQEENLTGFLERILESENVTLFLGRFQAFGIPAGQAWHRALKTDQGQPRPCGARPALVHTFLSATGSASP